VPVVPLFHSQERNEARVVDPRTTANEWNNGTTGTQRRDPALISLAFARRRFFLWRFDCARASCFQ
jgi:hypothetical protein